MHQGQEKKQIQAAVMLGVDEGWNDIEPEVEENPLEYLQYLDYEVRVMNEGNGGYGLVTLAIVIIIMTMNRVKT